MIVYYGCGIALGIAIAVAVGQDLLREHGRTRKNVALLAIIAVAFGLLLGWAFDTFVNYVQLTAAR